MTSKIFTFLKKYKYLSAGIVFLIIILFFILKEDGTGVGRAVVTRATVKEEIMITGKTKPQASVDLGFNSSGRVAVSNVKVGQKVKKGDVLASLEAGDLLASLHKAEAALQEENVRLSEISSNSPANLQESKEKVAQAVKSSFSLADNAVRNKADQFFKTPRTNPSFEISVTNGTFVHYFPISNEISIDVNFRRQAVEKVLNDWQTSLLTMTPDSVSEKAQRSLSYLDQIGVFLDRVAFAVNSFESADYSYDATVNGYKTAIDSARVDVSAARSSLVTALQSLSSSPVSIDGVVSSVSIQQAKVNGARSDVDSIKASLNKSYIVAPFDGVIVKADANVGEVANIGTPLISLISENNMYVEAEVSEIKIGKISVGNKANITLDAFPEESFTGSVVFIEPGETVLDGVPNYKIRIELGSTDERLKSGLSANLTLGTDERTEVLSLPVYTLVKEKDLYFVEKIINGKPVKTEVQVGLVGSDGNAEIISGIQAGESVAY